MVQLQSLRYAFLVRRKHLLPLALLIVLPAHAHIGSPDTFVQATAGPYKFLLAAHPPALYPGALELDLRLNPDDHITTATVSLDNGAPTPIQIFDAGTATASIWLPNAAAHTLHITVQGNPYDLNLPDTVPPRKVDSGTPSSWWYRLGFLLLFAISLWLVLRRKRSRSSRSWWQIVLLTAGCLIGSVLLFVTSVVLYGKALAYIQRKIYGSQTVLTANLTPNGTLDLTLSNPGRDFSTIVPDHGKLLHLFLIRQPQQDVFLHLHPQQLTPGRFSVPLPAMPPGTYRLFADYYLAPGGDLKNAQGETPTITLDLPAQFHPSAAPDPDDSIAVIPPSSGVAHSSAASSPMSWVAKSDGVQYISTIRDGYTLQLVAPATIQPLHANLFQVTLLDPSGHPPADMALYLGMPAHTVVLRSDNSVFAHIHPGGTLPMLEAPINSMPDMPGMSMPMDMPMPPASNTASIPYGFPSAGRYRLFVQMKHGPIIETAAFDLNVQ
jgi:hypothetical protein